MRESAHPGHTRRNRQVLYGRSVCAAAQTQVPELEPELARWLVEAGEPELAGWTDVRLPLVEVLELWGGDLVFKIGGKMYAVTVLELGPLLAWVRSWRLAEWAGWAAS